MRILLIVYDDASYIHTFPCGLAYIAAALRNEGCDVEIYNQDLHHYPEEHLTQHLNQNTYDMVGIGMVAGYYQYSKLLKISKAIAQSTNRPAHYILGGHAPSPEPEYFLTKTQADIAVIGEGDETIVHLVRALSSGSPLDQVEGIAYRDGDHVTVTPRRTPIKDIDSLPWPAYDLFPIHYYRLLQLPRTSKTDFVMPVLSARGCTFSCNFCYRMDKGYRPRSPASIVEEIQYLQKDYGITLVDFFDELLMASEHRVIDLCETFMKARLNFKWHCNGRLNYARPDVLKLMKEAGCVYINYGIEAVDDTILKNMRKVLTTKQIQQGIEDTLATGISPGFNVIFGNIGETKETLQKGVDFLLQYDDGSELRTIRPVTPYPGSALYDVAIKKGLMKDIADFYENKHVNSDLLAVNFTELSDDEFYQCLMDANVALIENYHQKKMSRMTDITKELYTQRDANFRGYRQT